MVEYESFEDALQELGVNEEQLKRMVSEGALRAYRDNDKMKFRREDVENLKRSNLSDIGSAPSMTPTEVNAGLEVVEETDETILDLGELSEDIDFEDTGETSVPTVDISGGRSGDTGGLTGELVFDEGDVDFADADATIAMDEGLTFDDGDIGLETEPIGLDGGETVVGGEDLNLEDAGGGYDYGGQQMGYMPMAAPQIQVQERVRYVEILSSEKILSKIISFVLLIVMILTLAAFYSATANTDALGLANFGWSMNKGANSLNSRTMDTRIFPMSGDRPMDRTSPEYAKPINWAIASGSSAEAVTFAGLPLIRDNDNRPDTNAGGRAARPGSWYTVTNAEEDAAAGTLPERFRNYRTTAGE